MFRPDKYSVGLNVIEAMKKIAHFKRKNSQDKKKISQEDSVRIAHYIEDNPFTSSAVLREVLLLPVSSVTVRRYNSKFLALSTIYLILFLENYTSWDLQLPPSQKK